MIHNFNAGPSILPKEVFEEASRSILNFNDSGLSILEIGHRTPQFETVLEEARQLVKELLNLSDEFEVLFLHGGATTQFMQVPMNLLNENETAAYTLTGTWSNKALKEAKDYGNIVTICDAQQHHYHHLPKAFSLPSSIKYIHLTSNETIHGLQWQQFDPFYNTDIPLVVDMSSDIFSRTLDFNKFSLIYAGAQKNMGAAGVNLVVIKKDILGTVNRKIPTVLNYQNHIDNGSMLNTPPVFAIYVAMLTLRWLKNKGGISFIEKENQQKAALLYNTIDALPIFKPTVAKEDRSKMNVCFVMEKEELEKDFLLKCKEEGIYGIKGHRSVGGFRASLYNALPLQSVVYLTELMHDFAEKNT
jgi:phosphoserine aminotransferase